MHPIILSAEQVQLLPFIKKFNKDFYLAGGTAIALHIGHRRSIDFDLFTPLPIKSNKIQKEIKNFKAQVQPIFLDSDQQHFIINTVKCTFLHFPYQIKHGQSFDEIINMPSLLDLAAMKAFDLGKRSKWKDYVDMYFMLKNYFSLNEIVEKAVEYFPGQITTKLFRNQLAFHKDIDYAEIVDFVIDAPPSEKTIKDYLVDVATSAF